MKKNMILGLLVMATGMVLAGCASLEQTVDGWLATKWDKNEKTTALIYFDKNVRLHSIDGKDFTNVYGQAIVRTGSGTKKKPKVEFKIPAGERKVKLSYFLEDQSGADFSIPREITFAFLPGRVYQLSPSTNNKVRNPAFEEMEKKAKADGEAAIAAAGSKADGTVGGMTAGVGAGFSANIAIGKEIQKLKETTPEYAMNVEIIDITGGKTKNSLSQTVTVNGW